MSPRALETLPPAKAVFAGIAGKVNEMKMLVSRLNVLHLLERSVGTEVIDKDDFVAIAKGIHRGFDVSVKRKHVARFIVHRSND